MFKKAGTLQVAKHAFAKALPDCTFRRPFPAISFGIAISVTLDKGGARALAEVERLLDAHGEQVEIFFGDVRVLAVVTDPVVEVAQVKTCFFLALPQCCLQGCFARVDSPFR